MLALMVELTQVILESVRRNGTNTWSLEQGMMIEFAKNMADFLAGSGKKHIIVLSSLDFGKWQKVEMSR